jgi:hypothetical protein
MLAIFFFGLVGSILPVLMPIYALLVLFRILLGIAIGISNSKCLVLLTISFMHNVCRRNVTCQKSRIFWFTVGSRLGNRSIFLLRCWFWLLIRANELEIHVRNHCNLPMYIFCDILDHARVTYMDRNARKK